MKIALISCSKSKQQYACMAKDLYSPSELFSVSYQYAKSLGVDKIYILSAKHGLIHEDTLIAPYELSMKNLPAHRRIDWANFVKKQMENEFDQQNTEFIILAGMDYLTPLLQIKALNNYIYPLRGMNFGTRIAFMNKEVNRLANKISGTNKDCLTLHQLLGKCQFYNFNEINEINFKNGIYIIFGKGEHYKEYNRIVRVGTHTSPNRLLARLRDHYLSKNKDGSIFRKNIGKAILNKNKNDYIQIWNLNTSKPQNAKYINHALQRKIEDEVSEYLQQNTFFTAFEVVDADTRLRLESAIIATLHSSSDFHKSANWLGNYSTEYEIRDSGMWLKQGLNDPPLTNTEMLLLQNILKGNNSSQIPIVTVLDNTKTSLNEPIKNKVTTVDIENYIKDILKVEYEHGATECVLISGDIAKKMALVQRMPMVCSAMRKVMGFRDEVLYSPPKGNGTTLKIKYYL